MSDKPITGSGALFGGLLGVPQSEKDKEEYLRRLKEAQRWLAANQEEYLRTLEKAAKAAPCSRRTPNESPANQKEKGWIN